MEAALEEVPPVPAQALRGKPGERLTDVLHDAVQPPSIDGQEGSDKGGDPLRRRRLGAFEIVARRGLGRPRAGEPTLLVLPGLLGRGEARLGALVRLPILSARPGGAAPSFFWDLTPLGPWPIRLPKGAGHLLER